MPEAGNILTNNCFTKKGDKVNHVRSSRIKRLKHGRIKHLSRKDNSVSRSLGQPTLCVLSKPENGVTNGKSRHRFPDPSQDKHVLLGIFDSEQTLFKLNYIEEHGICMDEVLEKEVLKHPLSLFYFVKLEQVQVDLPNGKSEMKTGYFHENIVIAKLSDHTVSDSCVPKQVAGFWVRTFGQKCTFTMNFTLWSAEVNRKGCGNNYFPFKEGFINEYFHNLQKLDEIHVQFKNRVRERKKNATIPSKAPSVRKTLLENSDLLMMINKLRALRDNGKLSEFNARSNEMIDSAKRRNNIDQELVIVLEKSICLCYQGNLSESKRLLQKAVQMSSKSSSGQTIKNRAYLFLASIHINDGNFGTAQECLGMVSNGVDGFLSAEDLEYRLLLHGIIMMNFGTKISNMSQNLWFEAIGNFEKALELNTKYQCDGKVNDRMCIIHLWLAKLYFTMLKSVCFPGYKMPDLENKIIEQITAFENVYGNKLSNRTMIFGLLIKAEYYKFLLKHDAASSVIEAIQELMNDETQLYFYEIKTLNKLIQLKEHNEDKNQEICKDMIKKIKDFDANSESESGYTADESSSDEKIELTLVKYEQTTYV